MKENFVILENSCIQILPWANTLIYILIAIKYPIIEFNPNPLQTVQIHKIIYMGCSILGHKTNIPDDEERTFYSDAHCQMPTNSNFCNKTIRSQTITDLQDHMGCSILGDKSHKTNIPDETRNQNSIQMRKAERQQIQ